jgi:hypothetical protein
MRLAPLALLLVAGVIAGCGGGDDSEKAASTPAAEATQASGGASAGGGPTKPGAELGLGQTAHVKFKPLAANPGDTKTYEVDATVLSIKKASLDDFKDVSLDADQKSATPYYVKVKVAAAGGAVPTKNDDPDIRFSGIDDRNQRQSSVTFIGDFKPCDNKEPGDSLAGGKSYESCLTFLVGGGGSIKEVRWAGADETILKPIVWK